MADKITFEFKGFQELEEVFKEMGKRVTSA